MQVELAAVEIVELAQREDIIERATANWMRRFYNRQPVVTAIVVDA